MKTVKSTQIQRAVLVGITFASLSGSLMAQDSLQINLKEIIVSSSFVNERTTPLRLKTVSRKDIDKKAIGSTYPELVKDIPGVYATSESGSYGDARINIRGFKQENISVMLNGIPVSGLTTGNMFWNNWLGLTDATHSIQVQKGIGASMLSDNSVGGTINIITGTPASKPSFSIGNYYTDYGLGKSSISFNSGENKNGWAVSGMLSYAWGQSYAKATDVNSWAYLVSISKKFNDRHSILFNVLGSPERHQQRSARLSATEVEQYGLDYNKNWGYLNGEKLNLSENFYHKPYFTLNHFYKHSNTLKINNALYFSIGDGGGRWSESKGKRILDFQKGGQIDWDAVVAANKATSDGSSLNILSDYLAGHYQIGAKSVMNYTISPTLSLESGIHYQFYSTWEKERITDLLGGTFWYEDYKNSSLAGEAGRNPIKRVGDYIRTNNGKVINHLTAFSMISYSAGKWDLRLGASVMGSTNRRWDQYNYVNSIYSETATAAGYSLKGGALLRVNRSNSIYFNAASYSRMPYSDVFFSSGNNNITKDVKNEKNLLAEIGYRVTFARGSAEVTAYTAYWKNKSVMSNPYKALDNTNSRYLIQGLDALHNGIEINAEYKPLYNFTLAGYASIADWKWKNDVSANIYDEYSGQIIDVINVYSNGLPVGDSPQNQVALSLDYKPYKWLSLNAEAKYNGRLYADFEPRDRKNPSDRAYSFRLPDHTIINVGAVLNGKINKVTGSLFLNFSNLLNTKYIERGKDGQNHDLASFRGFWGSGFNSNFGLRINF